MDFRFLADEDNASTYFSSSSTDGYFTQQALRAGYFSNEMGRVGFVRSSDPVRESMQREFEKKRIREEIIAAEIVRKRALEAEVRRELAMERDLAVRRAEGFSLVATMPAPLMWSESRVPLSHHSDGSRLEDRLPFPAARPEVGALDRLPFQRHSESAKVTEVKAKPPLEVSKGGKVGKVVFLAKPMSPNIAGTKRKATAVGASEPAVVGLKKKPHKEWSCALCQVSATSEQGLNEHLQGKKHKSKEAELVANKMAGKNTGGHSPLPKKSDKLITLTKNNGIPEPKHGTKEDGKPAEVKKSIQKRQKTEELKKKKFKLWCEHCHVGCHSETVMAAHRKGKKHAARMQGLNKNDGALTATSTTTTITTTTSTKATLGKAKGAAEESNEELFGSVDGEAGGVEAVKEEEPAEAMEAPNTRKESESEALEKPEDNTTEEIDNLAATHIKEALVVESAEVKDN